MSIDLAIRRSIGRILRYWPYGYKRVNSLYQRESGDSVEVVQREIGMEEYFEKHQHNDARLSNSFSYYEEIVGGLLGIEDARLVPLYELQGAAGKVIGLRHDVDNNPGVALRMARYLARVGVCGSFYLLHTAPYFERTPEQGQAVRELVLGFIVAGCELGLHTDPYELYARGIDGAARVKAELEWLRSQGATVRGTVGHNSAPAYGCENFEVFRERVMWDRKMPWPLGVLSERKLGLQYEGNFPVRKRDINTRDAAVFTQGLRGADVRNEEWMKKYLVDNPLYDREIDYQFWLIGKDRWVAGGKDMWEWMIGLDMVLELVRGLPANTCSVVVTHPDYFTA